MVNFIYYCGQSATEQDGQNAKIVIDGRPYNFNTDKINSNNQKQDKYGNNQLVESRNYLERLYGY